jgi:hypothetical protein
MTSLAQIEAKTFQNKYGQDFFSVMPYKVLESARDPMTNIYPMGGYCVPQYEPVLAGLNQAQVVAGENELNLYTTFTRCPWEFDCRFYSQQM